MMSKFSFIPIVALFSVVHLSALAMGRPAPKEFTVEEIAQYKQVYQNPFVVAFRERLDEFNEWRDAGKSEEGKLIVYDELLEWEKYLSGKFTVYMVNDTFAGGKIISVLFLDKPDHIFNAWLYPTSEDFIELRSFRDSELPKEEIKQLRYENKVLLENEDLSL